MPVQLVKEIITDAADLAKCEKELILDLSDVALIKDPADWARLGLSPASKSALEAATGGSGGSGGSFAKENKLVSEVVKDAKQLNILHSQLIMSKEDVELLSPDDWKQLEKFGISQETQKAIQSLVGSSGVYAVEPSELAQYLPGQKFSTDLLILDNEMIYTLEDVFRLTKEDWAELADKRLIPEARKRLEAALPPRPVPLKGRPKLTTPIGSVIHEVYFYRCRNVLREAKLEKMSDVMNMSAEQLSAMVSQPAVQKIEEAKRMIEEDMKPKEEPATYLDEAWDQYEFDWEPTRGIDPQAASKCAILKKRIEVLDRAIRCAHRLALQAEMEAIRRADEVAKLKYKLRTGC